MTISFTYHSGFSIGNQPVSGWDDDILERTARALYLWRRPQQSWYQDLHEIGEWSIAWFYRWADEFLNAAMPDGADSEEWYPEDAAKVYHQMSHDGCMYSDMEEERWPQVGYWYEHVAASVMNAALHDVPVNNSAVLPLELRGIRG
jgi:hypothetical protein